MYFCKFLLGKCMSNYFFSLSSFICNNFEFICSTESGIEWSSLHLHKVLFHSSGERILFFRPSTYLRSFISINIFSLPWANSHRGKTKYCGNKIYMKRIIWFSTCHKMFATKPSIVNLLLRFGPVLSLHCCNPLFMLFCCLLIFHGKKSINLDILPTFSTHICALYCTTTVWHPYNNC